MTGSKNDNKAPETFKTSWRKVAGVQELFGPRPKTPDWTRVEQSKASYRNDAFQMQHG